MFQSSLLDSGICSLKRRWCGSHGKENSPNKKARKALAAGWLQNTEQNATQLLHSTSDAALLQHYYANMMKQDEQALIAATATSINQRRMLSSIIASDYSSMHKIGHAPNQLIAQHLSQNNLLANIIGGTSAVRGSMLHRPSHAGASAPTTSMNTSIYSFRAGSLSPETPVSWNIIAVSEFGRVCQRRELRVNVGKSKVMMCSRYGNGDRMHDTKR